jgi:glucuronosyltransferase
MCTSVRCVVISLCLISVHFVPPATSGRILVLSLFTSKSHKITYMNLMEELASRGHQLTIVSSLKPFKVIPNVTEVYTYDTDKVMQSGVDFYDMKARGEQINPFTMISTHQEICETSYDLPQVQAILKQKFDLIIMEHLFNDCYYGIVHKLGSPFIMWSVTSIPNFVATKIGGYLPPTFVPGIFFDMKPEMSFVDRFLNYGTDLMMEGILRFYYEPAMAEVYRKKLGDPNIPSVSEITSKASLIMGNEHFSISGHKPFLPDVVTVGGIHSRPAKPLPKVIQYRAIPYQLN